MSGSSPSPSPSLQDLRAARGRPPSRRRRFGAWLIAGALLLVLILFGFFGLPPILKAQAIKQLTERLGRKVTIESVRVNPLTLSATIEGFSIAEAAPQTTEFLAWKRVYANLAGYSLLVGKIRFQELALDGFRGRIEKYPDGSLNFDDIIAKLLTAKPADPRATSPARPPAIGIEKLAVTDARIVFTDASRSKPFTQEVGPLSFSLAGFHTVGDSNTPYLFEATTTKGERVAWTGTLSADPVRSDGELILENIDLAHLSPYYDDLITGELRSAFVDAAGKYSLNFREGLPAVTLKDGTITLRDVRFGAPGNVEDALALRRLTVTGLAANSTTMQATVTKVSVEGVQVKATRDPEGIDLLRLAAPTRPRTKTTNPSLANVKPNPPPPQAMVTVGELSISGVEALVIDLTTPRRAEHRIENLVLTLRDFDSTQLARPLPLDLVISLPRGGRIAVTGNVTPLPLAADLKVALDRVPFANASPYTESLVNIRVAEGALHAHGQATLLNSVLDFSGDFGISGFATVDGKQAKDFVKWTDLAITGIKFGTAPLAFHADEIRFIEPSANLRIEADGTLSIAKVGPPPPSDAGLITGSLTAPPASPPASSPDQAAGSAAPPFTVTVSRLAFERAAFRFEDRSISPAARAAFNDFTGEITGLSSETLGRADVNVTGKVDGVAPVGISGKLNPLGHPAFVDLLVDFKGIDLQPGAGPYIGKFAGRKLTRGNVSVALKAKLQDRKVDLANVVTLDQFYLGEKTNSPEATTLPVGLALALLRDTDGKIVIDLPVKGSLDDPNFRIGRVMVRVLVNIITKVATSPFSLLGATFGGGGDELAYQEFPAGAVALSETEVAKLRTLAQALNARPALGVDVVGNYDPTSDLAALQTIRLDEQIRATAWETRRQVDPNTPPPEQIDITPALREGMLAKLYAEVFPASQITDESALNPPLNPTTTTAVDAPPVNRNTETLTPPRTPSRSAAGQGTRRQFSRVPRAYVRGEYRNPYASTLDSPRPASPRDAPQSAPTTVTAKPEADTAALPHPANTLPATTEISLTEKEARLAELMDVPETELRALADARAQAIRTWLLETGKIAPERIFLAPTTTTGRRVNLNLK